MLKPFLKWAGGKRWLARDLSEHFDGFSGTYVEPFLGSGAIFFHFQPESSILSDMNSELITTYLAIRDSHELVRNELQNHANRHSETYYYEIRSEQPSRPHEIAARLIYLNRTCWNGLYRVNRKGQFNVPIGTKDTVIDPSESFSDIAKALSKASIRKNDFEETIDLAKEGDLIFADPPYTVAHNNNGFVKYNETIFSWDDQVRLAEALQRASKRGCRVISTNAAHDDLKALYQDNFHVNEIARHTVISGQNKGRKVTAELFVTNSA